MRLSGIWNARLWLVCTFYSGVLCVCLLSVWPQDFDSDAYINIKSILHGDDIEFTWDPQQSHLNFFKENFSVELEVDTPWALINGRQILPLEQGILRDTKGNIFLLQIDADRILYQLSFYLSQKRGGITTIIIDPGHGGKDSGAVAHYDPKTKEVVSVAKAHTQTLKEKDLVLKIGLLLQDYLEKHLPEHKIFLLRDKDHFFSLSERVRIANNLLPSVPNRSLYISLHANSSLSKKAYGIEIWHVPLHFDRLLFKDINTDFPFSDGERLQRPLNFLLHQEYGLESQRLAQYLLDAILDKTQGKTYRRGIKADNFVVVTDSAMTSVLIEVGFIDHKKDLFLLLDPSYLQKLVEGVYSGLKEYIADYGA